MRVSNRIISIIKESVKLSFGDSQIYLFGSRVDDTKKGGDIDIAIQTNLSSEQFQKNKIKVISSLVAKDFDLKIDFVQYPNSDSLLNEEIENNSILL